MKGIDRNTALIGTAIAAVVFVAGIGTAWGSLVSRVDSLAERIDEMAAEDKDSLCQQLVMRQVAAIEKDVQPVIERIGVMAKAYGCLKRFGGADAMTVNGAGSGEFPIEAGANAAEPDQEWLERQRFRRALGEIDEALFPDSVRAPLELPSWMDEGDVHPELNRR